MGLTVKCFPIFPPNTTRQFLHQHLVQTDQKITVGEPLADLESKNTETWQKLHDHAIVATEANGRLQKKINKSVTCRLCQGSVQLVENLLSKNGLGSTWMFQYRNESCPSHETNLAFPIYRWRSRGSLKGFYFSRAIADKQELLGRSHPKNRRGSEVEYRRITTSCLPSCEGI